MGVGRPVPVIEGLGIDADMLVLHGGAAAAVGALVDAAAVLVPERYEAGGMEMVCANCGQDDLSVNEGFETDAAALVYARDMRRCEVDGMDANEILEDVPIA